MKGAFVAVGAFVAALVAVPAQAQGTQWVCDGLTGCDATLCASMQKLWLALRVTETGDDGWWFCNKPGLFTGSPCGAAYSGGTWETIETDSQGDETNNCPIYTECNGDKLGYLAFAREWSFVLPVEWKSTDTAQRDDFNNAISDLINSGCITDSFKLDFSDVDAGSTAIDVENACSPACCKTSNCDQKRGEWCYFAGGWISLFEKYFKAKYKISDSLSKAEILANTTIAGEYNDFVSSHVDEFSQAGYEEKTAGGTAAVPVFNRNFEKCSGVNIAPTESPTPAPTKQPTEPGTPTGAPTFPQPTGSPTFPQPSASPTTPGPTAAPSTPAPTDPTASPSPEPATPTPQPTDAQVGQQNNTGMAAVASAALVVLSMLLHFV